MIENKKALQHLSNDKILFELIQNKSPKPFTPSDDFYFSLLRAIAFQQLSGKAASTIFNRFLDQFEDGYPHPELVVEMSIDDMRAAGLSRSKSNYIKNIAQFFIEENLLNKEISNWTDGELIEYFTQIKGVGKWTVQMLLMFALGRPDVLPVDDLVIQQSMQDLYQLQDLKGKKLKIKMEKIAEAWRPYRSLASRYLWRWKDTTF